MAIALRLDPESFNANTSAGHSSYDQGRLADAARYYEKATALDETALQPALMLISCYRTLGDGENASRIARAALDRAEKAVARDRSNGYAMQVAVAALAELGEHDRAKDWMRRALLVDPDNLLTRYNFACTLATSLADPEAALAMLKPALEGVTTDHLVKGAPNDPDFASLHDDPRFQAMVAAAEARLAAAQPADGAAAPEAG